MKKRWSIVLLLFSTRFSLAQFPAETTSLFPAKSDSIVVPVQRTFTVQPASEHRLQLKKQHYLGLMTMAVCGYLSWHFHQSAETVFRQYERSGNISEMDELYRRALRYDRISGWNYAGMQVGFLITVVSFGFLFP